MKDFFVKLYDKFIHLSWVQWTITYCKENPVMASVVGGVLLFTIVILSILRHRSRKAKKAAKKARKAAKKAEALAKKQADEIHEDDIPAIAPAKATPPKAQAAPVEEKPEVVIPASMEKPKEAQPVAEVKKETPPPTPVPAPAEEVVEEKVEPIVEKKEEPKAVEPTEKKEEPAPAKEEAALAVASTEEKPAPAKKAPAKKKAPVKAAEKPAEAVAPEKKEEAKAEPVQETPAPVKAKKAQGKQTETKAPVNEIEETIALVESMEDQDDPLSSHYDEGDTDRIARYKGKWVICRVLTDANDGTEMFFFELRASNGEKLLSSEEYTTYQGALRGIQTHKTNILKGNLKVTLSKKGDYIFKLLSGKNMLLCLGENYPTKARCESAIDSTIRFAATAIIDENVQDILVKVPKEDDAPITPLPENCTGKWIVSSSRNAQGEKIFGFELYANNGEKLLASEEYTTYIGAVNGIETHKKNIEKDNFRISLTKRGDYIYKLLNANGQLLCLGEHYKTKRLCQNAVESVKRFAMNSPMLTDADK